MAYSGITTKRKPGPARLSSMTMQPLPDFYAGSSGRGISTAEDQSKTPPVTLPESVSKRCHDEDYDKDDEEDDTITVSHRRKLAKTDNAESLARPPSPSQLYISNRRNSGPNTILERRWDAETRGCQKWRHKLFSSLEDVTKQTKQERMEIVAYICCITQRKPELYFLCIPIGRRPDCLPENPLNASSKLLKTIKKCLLQEQKYDMARLGGEVQEWLRKADGGCNVHYAVPARSQSVGSSDSEYHEGCSAVAATRNKEKRISKKRNQQPLALPPLSTLRNDMCQTKTPAATPFKRNSLANDDNPSSSSTSNCSTASRSSSITFSPPAGAGQLTPHTPLSSTATMCTPPPSVSASATPMTSAVRSQIHETPVATPITTGKDAELARYLSKISRTATKLPSSRTSAVIRMEMEINEAEIEAKQAKHDAEQSRYEAKQLLIQGKKLQLELHLKEREELRANGQV